MKIISDKVLRESVKKIPTPTDSHKSTLGIALSGGGSRAIAFHLGCFRALYDMGLLDKVDHISSVSGGSVFSALYSYSNDNFESFDDRIVETLRKGLQWKIARKHFLSFSLLKALATNVTSGPTGIISEFSDKSSLLRRFYSRTNSFRDVLEENYFKNLSIDSPRRNDIDIIINACELTYGSSFSFGSKESGSWRLGKVKYNNISLSDAVACSAAYPILLPALDKIYEFEKDDVLSKKRVSITDGGVYDNSGVTKFDPTNNPKYSLNSFKPDYIFAFDAGSGIYRKEDHPYYFYSRIIKSYGTTHRKNQDSIKYKMHSWIENNKIKGFIYTYLGQNDNVLPYKPSDLIKNADVSSYPTDFAAMNKDDIQLISGRGEQLTRLLVSYYSPNI